MKKSFFLFLLTLSISVNAQNLPSCDSLVINCCSFDSLGPNTLTIYASNYSSNLFDYPGFVLFDASMDTIAKETVNYFGIGQGPQPHTLDIVAPLILPFNGYLNLYTWFYTSLDCSFPYYIADTVNSVYDLRDRNTLKIYPNPAVTAATIEMDGNVDWNDLSVVLYDVTGRKVMGCKSDHSPFKINLDEISEGVYTLKVSDKASTWISAKKLIVGKK